ARRHRRARMTGCRVPERVHRTAAGALGAEPGVAPASGGKLATTEAVAAVRNERAANRRAQRILLGTNVGAARRHARDGRGFVVVALRVAARREIGRDREWIAAVAVVAAVVAGAHVTVEEAVELAGRSRALTDVDRERSFGVVAGPGAVHVVRVDR